MTAATAPTLYLPEILDHVRGVVRERKKTADLRALERAAAGHTPRGFARNLRGMKEVGGIAVIAELKKASPSKGLIRPDFDVAALAPELQDGGAACLSVLTEERFFQGSLENLRRASAAVEIPCLRKDFTVDEFQILEARANCADAILLIAAALTDAELRRFRDVARDYELDVLVEVHDREELERVIDLNCECVGVNSRDLRTFEVSLARAAELAALLPDHVVRVAESGLRTNEDILRMKDAGYTAFLIGESVMRKPSPGNALRALMGE